MAMESHPTESQPVTGAGERVAVIFGVTGLVGKELAKKLLSTDSRPWKVYGIARRKPDVNPISHPNFHFISCDLLNRRETLQNISLRLHDATHLFWLTWATRFPVNSGDCCDLNREMMANVLDAILPAATGLRYFSLQTGMHHYMNFSGDPSGDISNEEVVYYREDNPRLPGHNFYYVLEDLLRERLANGVRQVTWTVLRPAMILGGSHRTFINLIGTLCVYGAICKKLNLPFVFGGSEVRWKEPFLDASDAFLIADHHIWAAENEELFGDGEAFNVINGDRFAWEEIWGALGKKFGMESPGDIVFSSEFYYQTAMADKKEVWREIVEEEGLVKTEMEDLANWEVIDETFRIPVKLLASRDKSDRMGFSTRCNTLDSFLYWIDVMRSEKLAPYP